MIIMFVVILIIVFLITSRIALLDESKEKYTELFGLEPLNDENEDN